MKFSVTRVKLPTLANSLLAILSAVLLTLAFPDFDLWFLAWFALVPLFFAIEREKESVVKSFVLGWIFGVAFFFGTCWWLTFAPINYGGVPAPVAYLLLLGAAALVGLFPAIFAALFSLILKRFGAWGIFAAPFLWTAIEFLRFYATGNNWNAIGYSQAFTGSEILKYATFGGIYAVGFSVVWSNVFITLLLNLQKIINGILKKQPNVFEEGVGQKQRLYYVLFFLFYFLYYLSFLLFSYFFIFIIIFIYYFKWHATQGFSSSGKTACCINLYFAAVLRQT